MKFSLPMRWLGFVFNPSLVRKPLDDFDPEPNSIVKSMVLGERLAQSELYTHSVFMQLYQRLYKFFGPDQSWRNQEQFLTLQGMQQEFTMPLQARMPAGSSPEHLEQHARLVANVQIMLNHLSAAIAL